MDSTQTCPACHSTYRVELRPMLPYHTAARGLALTIEGMIEVAMEVAADRVTSPNSYPIVPRNADAKMWTRRLLARMVDAGVTPEGWEEAFFLDDIPVGD